MRIQNLFLIIFVFLLPEFKSKKKDENSASLDLNGELDKKLNELFSFYKDVLKNSEKKETDSKKIFETLENTANRIVKNDIFTKKSEKELKETSFIQNSMKVSSGINSVIFSYQPFVWTPFTVQQTGPSARRGHSAVLADTYMIIFGGCYMESTCYNDVHFLDLRTQSWIAFPATGEVPSARQGHSAVLYGSVMWVYGGSSSGGYSNELFSLNLESVNRINFRGSGRSTISPPPKLWGDQDMAQF
jgi:hypothetical protein